MRIGVVSFLFFAAAGLLSLLAGIGVAETISVEVGKNLLLATPAFGATALGVLIFWVL